jgi:hypothetical protein
VVIKGKPTNLSALPNPETLIASSDPTIRLPIAQITQLFAACSATNDAGNNAKTAATLLGTDPCDKAVQTCEQAGGGSAPCFVVSEGQWQAGSVAFAQCDSRLRKFTTWQAIMSFGNLFLFGQSIDCVLHVLAPGDALLIPDGDSPTAIAFEGKDQAAVVSVIEGSIRVVSRSSSEWRTISSGNTYAASNGRQAPTSDWLSYSELCENAVSVNTQSTDKNLIASAQSISQTIEYDSVRPESPSSFDRLESSFCRGANSQPSSPR